MEIKVLSAKNLPDTDRLLFNIVPRDTTDPYVEGYLGEARIFKTRFVKNQTDPHWDETFVADVCHHASSFVIKVLDKEMIGESLVAMTSIRLRDLIDGRLVDGWFDLRTAGGKSAGQIEMSVVFTPKDDIATKDPDYATHKAPDSYFLCRPNCKLTLYQDADTPKSAKQV